MRRWVQRASVINFLNSHQKQHLFSLFCLRGNQEGRNDTSLDVQDMFRLFLLWVKWNLLPFRNGQPELVPVAERVRSQACPFSAVSLLHVSWVALQPPFYLLFFPPHLFFINVHICVYINVHICVYICICIQICVWFWHSFTSLPVLLASCIPTLFSTHTRLCCHVPHRTTHWVFHFYLHTQAIPSRHAEVGTFAHKDFFIACFIQTTLCFPHLFFLFSILLFSITLHRNPLAYLV